VFWHMEFRVIDLPGSLDPAFDDTFMLDVVHGDELWLTSRTLEHHDHLGTAIDGVTHGATPSTSPTSAS
jgi:hypothetical protein